MNKKLTVFALFAFLFVCGGLAHGAVVNCSDPTFSSACAAIVNFSVTGGSQPYVYVTDPNAHYLDLSNPTQVNFSCPSSSCAGVSEQAAGSLSTGILQASGQAVTVYDDFDTVGVSANDIFTINGPANTSVAITASFKVAGTAMLQSVGPGGSVLIDGADSSVYICGPSGTGCDGDSFHKMGLAPFTGGNVTVTSDNTGNPYLLVNLTWDQQTNTAFDLAYGMTLDAYSGSSVDLFDPGTLSFTLPTGDSITSLGGFSQGVPMSPTPEPGSIGLAGVALAVTGLARRLFGWAR